MKFNGTNHIYKCVPPVLGNDTAETPVIIGLRGVNTVDMDNIKAEYLEYSLNNTQVKAAELVTESTIKFVAGKVASIENLEIDGKEITDFETFYKLAPQELVTWVMTAIHSTQILTSAELGNS